MTHKELKFYCMKEKKPVSTDKYKEVRKSGRLFAVATHSCGTKMWRILGRA